MANVGTKRPAAPSEPARAVAPALLHPDVVVGRLSEILQQVANPVVNTLADIGTYSGRPLAQLFPAPTKLPEVTVTGRWSLLGLISEDLVFPSLHVPLEPNFRRRYREQYRETHLVYARRIRPRSARGRPRLLYLHGYMQPETVIEELALLSSMALRLNVEVIQMQAPYHGRRTPRASRFSGEFYWTADLVRSVEALRQTLLDARTLLHWLLAEDPRPVGVTGLSLGGALTASLTCLEERFAFSIPLIAHMDLSALVADAPVLAKMRRELRSFGWGGSELRRFVASLGWNELSPKLPPEHVFLLAASDDRFFDPRIVKRMWAQWGKPAIRWYPTSHIGFLARLPDALRAMRAFIDR
ncbi:MAG TPA: alpha/beta hydrolase family protein [Candidatus Dormibacteraeota bacterium]|nr:alpha/beta hydrolase family protein [Candidatus Dormibacteraeota bacterium]